MSKRDATPCSHTTPEESDGTRATQMGRKRFLGMAGAGLGATLLEQSLSCLHASAFSAAEQIPETCFLGIIEPLHSYAQVTDRWTFAGRNSDWLFPIRRIRRVPGLLPTGNRESEHRKAFA